MAHQWRRNEQEQRNGQLAQRKPGAMAAVEHKARNHNRTHPQVVAFVGACIRVKKSGIRASPIEPTNANPAPTSSSTETTTSPSVTSIIR
jgi:hypothetical protein